MREENVHFDFVTRGLQFTTNKAKHDMFQTVELKRARQRRGTSKKKKKKKRTG